MVKIIDNSKTESHLSLNVGDWIYCYYEGDKTLCVIAQTEPNIGKLIAISNYCANRFNNNSFPVYDGEGRKLSQNAINIITNYGKIKIEPLNISIEITNNNS